MTSTVGDPTTHGVTIAGVQGTGAPADATAGLVGLLHIRKFGKFVILKSSIFADIGPPTKTVLGVGTNGQGADPKEHKHEAPATVAKDILTSIFLLVSYCIISIAASMYEAINSQSHESTTVIPNPGLRPGQALFRDLIFYLLSSEYTFKF